MLPLEANSFQFGVDHISEGSQRIIESVIKFYKQNSRTNPLIDARVLSCLRPRLVGWNTVGGEACWGGGGLRGRRSIEFL